MNVKPIILLIFLASAMVAMAQDAASLERLALRLLGGADDAQSQTRFVIAGVPEDLPFDFALAADSELLGSFVRRSVTGELMSSQIVVDSSLSLSASLDFYDALLQEQGWLVKLAPQALGFVTEGRLLSAMYCHPEGHSFTYVTASRLFEGGADVRFDLYQDESYSPCYPEQVGADVDLGNTPLPLLYPPADATTISLNKLLIVEPLSLSVLLTTERSQMELLAHYEAQFITSGWQQISQGESGDLSFGRWTFQDANGLIWTSILTLMSLGIEDEYYASVVVLLPVEGGQP